MFEKNRSLNPPKTNSSKMKRLVKLSRNLIIERFCSIYRKDKPIKIQELEIREEGSKKVKIRVLL
jgi:hypothetical protein